MFCVAVVFCVARGSGGLTWDDERGPGVDDAAVRPNAVPARRCGLHFEAYFPIGRVL